MSIRVTFDCQASNRDEAVEMLKRAILCIRDGETEVGGYQAADFNLMVTGDEDDEYDGPERTKLFALLSEQGTACDETCLCDQHYSEEQKASIEAQATKDPLGDAPVPGSWADCSGNEECRCTVCGWQPSQEPPDAEDGIEPPPTREQTHEACGTCELRRTDECNDTCPHNRGE